MKRLYTLMSLFACTSIFAINSYSQNISQNFNSQAEVDQLVAECWSFSGSMFTSTLPIEGAGSITNSGGGSFSFITPELTTATSIAISFSYNVLSASGGSKIFIESVSGGITTEIHKINVSGTGPGTYNLSRPITAGSNQIQIRTTGTITMKLDLLTIGAPYTHLGGCEIAPIILPIKLTAFSGNMINGNVNLDWSVTENETGDYFEVEKSDNGSKFIKAATVSVTNTYGSANYSTSVIAEAGNVNYYRLKVINKDGTTSYSKVLSFRNQNGSNTTLKVLQNPIVNGLSFNYQTEANGVYQVSLVSANGLRVLSTPMNLQKGTNLVSLNVNSSLPNGIYILEVAKGTERSIIKIIK
ncbi:MAG: T9SS type A sorting domain-containing protein [Chitinophagaceae bacterium]|nr:T9SS type A sorting domain-containing protein [Chitinophagaceae bacterium]